MRCPEAVAWTQAPDMHAEEASRAVRSGAELSVSVHLTVQDTDDIDRLLVNPVEDDVRLDRETTQSRGDAIRRSAAIRENRIRSRKVRSSVAL
jgi:hypothetical protein